jgi:cystathionine beta-lyase family protein involved in aluminum resistance
VAFFLATKTPRHKVTQMNHYYIVYQTVDLIKNMKIAKALLQRLLTAQRVKIINLQYNSAYQVFQREYVVLKLLFEIL